MGNLASLQLPLLPMFRKSHWVNDIKGIRRLIQRFEKVQTEFGYAITYDTFKALYRVPPSSSAPSIPDAELQAMWSLWDPLNKGRTDVLQIFAATIICCKGLYDEKISMLFDLFDMDMNRTITRDEMTIAIRASLCGYCRFLGVSPPAATELTEIARLAFKGADRQEHKDNKIEPSELILWSHITPQCMEIVGRFGTIDIDDIRNNNNYLHHHSGSHHRGPSLMTGLDGSVNAQNLNSLVDEAMAKEREMLKCKPSLPTNRELSIHERNNTKFKEEFAGTGNPNALLPIISHQPHHSPSLSSSHANYANSPSPNTASHSPSISCPALPNPYSNHPSSPPLVSNSPPATPFLSFTPGLASSAASSSFSPAASSSSSGGSSSSVPKWVKKVDDMLFLRHCFEKCELAGSGTPIEQALVVGGSGAGGETQNNTMNHNTPASPKINSSSSSSSSTSRAPRKPSLTSPRSCIPGTGVAPLIPFGSYMKSLGGKWRHLPRFRTLDGFVSAAGVNLSFRDVLRSYYTEFLAHNPKKELDAMVEATEEAKWKRSGGGEGVRKNVPQNLIEKIQVIFMKELREKEEKQQALQQKLQPGMNFDSTFLGEDTVSMNRLLEILKPSKKLREYVNLQKLIELYHIPSLHASNNISSPKTNGSPASSSSASSSSAATSIPLPSLPSSTDRAVTLADFLSFLFSRSHPLQIEQIVSWIQPQPNKPLGRKQRKELEKLWRLYEQGNQTSDKEKGNKNTVEEKEKEKEKNNNNNSTPLKSSPTKSPPLPSLPPPSPSNRMISFSSTCSLSDVVAGLRKFCSEEDVRLYLRHIGETGEIDQLDGKKIDWFNFQQLYRMVWMTAEMTSPSSNNSTSASTNTSPR